MQEAEQNRKRSEALSSKSDRNNVPDELNLSAINSVCVPMQIRLPDTRFHHDGQDTDDC